MCDTRRLERLEATGLTYTYPGSSRGIHGVDLCLERGSFTVVAGASGAGKTTLLRVLLGPLPRDAGEIRWNGVPIAGPGRFFAPPQVAYVAQARRGHEEDLYGEVTRALEGGVDLLVVDDLSAVLDLRQEGALWDRSFWRWGACLAVSNRLPALSRADRIIVLHEGRTVGEGRLEALLHTCPEMQRMWGRSVGHATCRRS